MRTAEDLAEEVEQLRNENCLLADQGYRLREELKAAQKELDWWKRTFGPESGR